jgi:hypothetical protein
VLRMRATLARRLGLQLRLWSSPISASRFQWLRISTPPQWPRMRWSHPVAWKWPGGEAAQIVVRIDGGLAALFVGAPGVHDDEAAGVGKVRLHRLDGEGVNVTHIYSSVGAFGLFKKGVD